MLAPGGLVLTPLVAYPLGWTGLVVAFEWHEAHSKPPLSSAPASGVIQMALGQEHRQAPCRP